MHTFGRLEMFLATAIVIGTHIPLAQAGCGCDKPPPPRSAVRPFAAHAGQTITIFDEALLQGRRYRVEFESIDGTTDWSAGRAYAVRDLADRQRRSGLEVDVPPLPLGPAIITVLDGDGVVLRLADDEFTVTPDPVELHEYDEAIVQDGYRAAVGRDGTLYVSLDVGTVSAATTFVAHAKGYPLRYRAEDIAIYNDQGFLMQILDPGDRELFEIRMGAENTSDELEYWRHEFDTYKRAHRRDPAKGRGDGTDWHADGSPHVDHDHLVVAIRGTFPDGSRPAPGSTPPFTLELGSEPAPR